MKRASVLQATAAAAAAQRARKSRSSSWQLRFDSEDARRARTATSAGVEAGTSCARPVAGLEQAAARGSPVSSPTSHSLTSDWTSRRCGRPAPKEYCAYSAPFGGDARTPVGGACLNSFRPAEISGNSSPAGRADGRARDRLQPGPARGRSPTAAGRRRRRSSTPTRGRCCAGRRSTSARRAARRWARSSLQPSRTRSASRSSRADAAAGPAPGKYWKTSPEPGKETRAPLDSSGGPSSAPRCAGLLDQRQASRRRAARRVRRSPRSRRGAGQLVVPRAAQAPDPALDVGQHRPVGGIGHRSIARPVELAQLRATSALGRLHGVRVLTAPARAPAGGQCARNRSSVSRPWSHARLAFRLGPRCNTACGRSIRHPGACFPMTLRRPPPPAVPRGARARRGCLWGGDDTDPAAARPRLAPMSTSS